MKNKFWQERFGVEWRKELMKHSEERLKLIYGIREEDAPKKKQDLVSLIRARLIVKIFNGSIKPGSTIKYYATSSDDQNAMWVVVTKEAFVSESLIPVVFFKDKPGYYSIEPCFYRDLEVIVKDKLKELQ